MLSSVDVCYVDSIYMKIHFLYSMEMLSSVDILQMFQ